MVFKFSIWVDALLKARGHKYIKRIPYSTPKGVRYRYIYKVTHTHRGKRAFDEDHLRVGAAFAHRYASGEEYHGHVTAVEGDRVTYRVDDGPEKGTTKTVSKRELLAELNDVHGIEDKLSAEREKVRGQLEVAREKGSAKQVARLEARLKRLGGEVPSSKRESGGDLEGRWAELFEKHRVSPEQVALDRWYTERPRHAHPWGHKLNDTKRTRVGEPDAAMYQRLEDLEERSSEACDRYNRGLQRALEDIQRAFVGSDAFAKRDKLVSEIEKLSATPAELARSSDLFTKAQKGIHKICQRVALRLKISKWDVFPNHLSEADWTEVAEVIGDSAARRMREIDDKSPMRSMFTVKDEGLLVVDGSPVISLIKQAKLREELNALSLDVAEGARNDLLGGVVYSPQEASVLSARRDSYAASISDDYQMNIENTALNSVRLSGVKITQKTALQHGRIIDHFVRVAREKYPDEYDLERIAIYYKPARKSFRESCTTTPNHKRASIKLSKKSTPSTVLHEIAHTLEYFSERVRDAVTLTHATRVKAGGVSKYSGAEKAFDDRYHDVYSGKLYNGSPSSELVTMGVQEFVNEARALRLLAEDPHHFAVTYGILKGYFNED